MRKKGYFFTIDAFLAISIIAIGLLIIISYRSPQTTFHQTNVYAEDLAGFITKTQINNLNSRLIDQWQDEGIITDTSKTVLEQAGEFVFLGELSRAKDLILNTSGKAIISAYDYSVIIDNILIINSSDTMGNAKNVYTTKRIVSGVINETIFWGPYIGEVRVWR